MINNNTTKGKIMSDFNFSRTISGKLMAEHAEDMKDVVFVPNSILPEKFHDLVRGGRSLKRLEELCDKRDGLSDHVKIKAIKERNIALLSAQVAEGETDIDKPFDWSQNEFDEIALNRHEIAMVNAMVASGVIDADDLLEEV
jgi:hypothetical protein